MLHFINVMVKNGGFHTDAKNTKSGEYHKYVVLLSIVTTCNNGDNNFNTNLLLFPFFALSRLSSQYSVK